MTRARHREYLRRNVVVAKSYGAIAGVEKTLARLNGMKRQPEWLMRSLREIEVRLREVPHELAQWRNRAPDAPRRRRK